VVRPNGPFCDTVAFEYDNIIFENGFDLSLRCYRRRVRAHAAARGLIE